MDEYLLHQIKNYLHGIGSYSDLGMKRIEEKPLEKLKDYFQKIKDVNKKLIEIFNKIEERMPELDLMNGYKFVEIVNLKNEKPSKNYDFYVDRRTPIGNPFILHSEEQRDEVCDWYEDYFNKKVVLEDADFLGYLLTMKKTLNVYGKLRLFCWCSPKRCHAETIKKYLIKE